MYPKDDKAFFDESKLPDATVRYVCWLDLIATKCVMTKSLSVSANFICKLHDAVAKSNHAGNLSLYPMMDGLYCTSERRSELEGFLKDVFCRLAKTFIDEENCLHRFIPRAAIACGPVIEGRDIPSSAGRRLTENYRHSLLFGIPMIQAYRAERKAPPFGVYIHESARAFCPVVKVGCEGRDSSPYTFRWWKWCSDSTLAGNLREALKKYFDYYSSHSYENEYDPGRLAEHQNMVCQ